MSEQQWNSYEKYLNSDVWKAKREAALSEAEYRCQLCGNAYGDLHVHHHTYPKHWGKEPVSFLTVLCASCHDSFHIRRQRDVMPTEPTSTESSKSREETTKQLIRELMSVIVLHQDIQRDARSIHFDVPYQHREADTFRAVLKHLDKNKGEEPVDVVRALSDPKHIQCLARAIKEEQKRQGQTDRKQAYEQYKASLRKGGHGE